MGDMTSHHDTTSDDLGHPVGSGSHPTASPSRFVTGTGPASGPGRSAGAGVPPLPRTGGRRGRRALTCAIAALAVVTDMASV